MPQNQLAHIRGFVGYQFILFIQMMTSTMTIVRIFEAYKKLTGNAQRFVEFGAKMAAIEKMEAESEGQQLPGCGPSPECILLYRIVRNLLVESPPGSFLRTLL